MSHPYPPQPGQPDPNHPGWPGGSASQGQSPSAYPGGPVNPSAYPGGPVNPSGQPASGYPLPLSGQPQQPSGAYPPPVGQPQQATGQTQQFAGAYQQPGPAYPGPPAGYPQQPGGYPGQPVPTGAPTKAVSKPLLIGLVAVAVVLLLVAGGLGIALLRSGDDGPQTAAPPVAASSGSTPTPATDPSAQESESTPDSNNAVTATYASDFEAVCEGGSVTNAAEYVPGSGTKAYAFSNSPDRETSWISRSMSSDEPYYAKSSEFTKVSVVGCLSYVDGSEGTGKSCEYQDRDKKQVKVTYLSSRYQLVFYAARTGKKIGDGGTINAPATRCPSFISYNATTKKAYASPDDGAVRAAFTKFLS